jgi:predicted RNase H-like HicB family nuclease
MASVMQLGMEFSLPAVVRRKGRWWAATCPPLDVHTQGRTEDEAKKNLVEALVEFFLSCFERGTLNAVLQESGFVPVAHDVPRRPALPRDAEQIRVPLPFLMQDRPEHHVDA